MTSRGGTTIVSPRDVIIPKEAIIIQLTKSQQEKWDQVHASQQRNGCACPLEPAMTLEELRPLNEGCTAEKFYVCPTLLLYRSLAPKPAITEEDDA